MKKMILILASALVLFGTAGAQDMMAAEDFDIDRVQPYGTVETDVVVFETDEDLGAIVLRHTTPDEQHANFDVVGPNGFYEHFDFEDADGGEYVLENLEPGVYSVAASDENLSLAHTIVEVTAGQSTSVSMSLEPWEGDALRDDFDAADTYGTYDGFGDDVQPGYPYGAYTVGTEEVVDTPETGAIFVESMENDAQLVVTGPNGFSETAGNDETLEDLPPGQYVLAATGQGTDLSVTTVQVRAGELLSVDPNFAQQTGATQQQDGAADQQNQEENQDGAADEGN